MASTETLEQETASGKWTVPVIIVAHITAKPGFGDEVAKHMAAIRDAAVGAPDDPSKKQEPGTFEYRITRYGDEFAIFEKYESAEAIKKHTQGPLADLIKAEIAEKVEWKHYQEF